MYVCEHDSNKYAASLITHLNLFVAQLKICTRSSSCIPLLPTHQPIEKQFSINSAEDTIEASHELLIAHQPAGNHSTLPAAASHAAISEVPSQASNNQLLLHASSLPISILGMYMCMYKTLSLIFS